MISSSIILPISPIGFQSPGMLFVLQLGDQLYTNSSHNLDMRQHFVIDPLISKRQQLLLATQLCRMVLKVCTIYLSLYYSAYFSIRDRLLYMMLCLPRLSGQPQSSTKKTTPEHNIVVARRLVSLEWSMPLFQSKKKLS